jgi:archaellum component FlaF (FlaF/FlaG flagellin family)
MKGISGVLSLMIIILSTVILLSIITLYYYTTINRAYSEVEEIVGGECSMKASIIITNYSGNTSTEKNLTVKNTGGVDLDLDSFRVYFIGKKVSYTHTDPDGILEVGEKTIFILPKDISLGPIKVVTKCEAMDEIDTRYLPICHDGLVGFVEECEVLEDCEVSEFPYGECTGNRKCEECDCTGVLDCSGILTECAIGSDAYCTYCVEDVNYCYNCAHCGDGICNCGEDAITCPSDCS